MDAFSFLSVALSFVVGLSITYLFTNLLEAFRARNEIRLDWLPVLWAVFVFAHQFQFWWAIYELAAIRTWTVALFGILLFLSMLLFVAAGLILPRPSDAEPVKHFTRDGRWGVGALAAYNCAGPVANVVLFKSDWVTPVNGLALALMGTAIAFILVSSRRWMVVLTMLFGALLAAAVVAATRWSYGVA